MLILIKQLKRPFMRPKQDVCRWEFKASNCGTTLSCTTSQTMIGRCILYNSHLLYSATTTSACSMRHYAILISLRVQKFQFSIQSSVFMSYQTDSKRFIPPLSCVTHAEGYRLGKQHSSAGVGHWWRLPHGRGWKTCCHSGTKQRNLWAGRQQV